MLRILPRAINQGWTVWLKDRALIGLALAGTVIAGVGAEAVHVAALALAAGGIVASSLQGHAVGGFAACITRDTDDASGHGAHMGQAGGEEGGMRTAEAQRNAEALR